MKNYLGQNFLINKNKIKKIIEALDLKPNETIIEIGAGHGEITIEIIQKSRNQEIKKFKIFAIEKDKKLADILRNSIETKWKLNKNSIEIIHGDALKVLPNLISQFPNFPISVYKLVGNIPFYITGRLLRIISELKLKPSLAVFIMQKEVGQRICALRQAQGKPKMNLLAANVQFWAEPKIIGYISKKEFKPASEVDAAIIKLANRVQPIANREIAEKYYKLVQALFKQPRKTILNNLILSANIKFNVKTSDVRRTSDVQKLKEEIVKKLAKLGINPQDRPQNLSIEQIKNLSTFF